MNRLQLVKRFSEFEAFESKAQAGRALEFLKDIMKEELSNGNEVQLGQNFGTFKPVTRSGKAPKTGKPYTTNLVKFKISAPFREQLNNK